MWTSVILLLPVAFIVHSQSYDNLDNLSERISAQGKHQLAPLDGLGKRMNAQLLNNLRKKQVNLQKKQNARKALKDRKLQIARRKLHQKLERGRAKELNLKIKGGVGGTTIATHSPGGRQFLIQNYKIYNCVSPIDLTTGQCSYSIPFKITPDSPESDWCYIERYSRSNNQVCLSTGSVSMQVINNQMSCKSNNDEPLLEIDLESYKNLCAGVRESTEFRYIPDLNDDRHVEIPNKNNYVICKNRQKDLCVIHERNRLLDRAISFRPSGFYITHNVHNV